MLTVVGGVLFVGVLGLILFGFPFGAPFLPVHRRQTEKALDLIDLEPGQVLLDLGSGSGRVISAAARRGIRAVGYEVNPLLVAYSWLATWRYRDLVRVRWVNIWTTPWPADTSGAFAFLLTESTNRLHKKITAEHQGSGLRVVSYTFEMGDKHPLKEEGGLFLYEY